MRCAIKSYVAALRTADEREARVKKVFHKFDIDQSGTIDMDELLIMLDDLGMLEPLQSEPTVFLRDMFVQFDVNRDGVLCWEEFVGLYNAAHLDALGRRPVPNAKEGPKSSRERGRTAEARNRLAAERAAQKAEEAERIHRQNQEMRARILAQGSGRDAKTLDEEVEQQRRALAGARAKAKAEERARIENENRSLIALPWRS